MCTVLHSKYCIQKDNNRDVVYPGLALQVALGLLVGMIVASSVSYNSCTAKPACTNACSATIPR